MAEVGGDVGEGAVGLAAEHALVGAGGGEGSEVGDVGSDFDIVELLAVEEGVETIPAKVIAKDGVHDITLNIKGLTPDEKEILLEGNLMNYYKAQMK